ncbi:MAG: hypothetical protein WB919_22490 [Candidatus Sulfotelmatobacter sp.]
MAFCGLTAEFAFAFLRRCLVAACTVACCLAYGQVAYPEQEIRVHDLAQLTARSTHASDVLATSLEMVFNDKQVCCGKDSALEDSVQSSDPKSLKDVASKLQGRHLLSDGRPIMVAANYLPMDAVNAGRLITAIANQHALLMEWNSHLYVVGGVSYVESESPGVDGSGGGIAYAIHKFLLQDARFSDSHRAVTFDRLIDDAGKVQGFLFVQASPQ